MRNPTILPLLAILALSAAHPLRGAGEPAPPFSLGACKEPGLPAEARCGTYEVFENRETRTGRKIPLQVVVLPARDAAGRLPDPFVYFAGGPGDSSIREGLFFAQELAALRKTRDVLLVDLRGTGGSAGLFCTEMQGKQGIQGFLDDFLPAGPMKACRDRLQATADLSWYVTGAAVDDVEEVRTALGYGPVNLMGGSYGTRAVLTYLRRHPQSVRTITLLGVVPPDDRYPLNVARSAQTALEGLLAECEGDAACREAFPELRQELAAVMERVTAEPVRVSLFDLDTGEPFEIRLGRAAVAQTLRYMTYSPADAALLPLLVHAAAGGNFEPLAQTARLHATFLTSTADGFYQSVTCAEDVAFIRPEEIPAAVEGTLLGDFRVQRQRAACEGWPVRDPGREIQAPVVSDVPALLISGERDPVTPAANGDRVVSTLKNGLHLVVADGAHSLRGMQGGDCLTGVMAAFIESGKTEGLETSCVGRMRRPAFVTSFGDPEVKPVRANLERLAGTYRDPESGLTMEVGFAGSRLRCTLDGAPALLLPTSQTRFRIEGFSPETVLEFQLREGRITGVVLRDPSRPDLTLAKQD